MRVYALSVLLSFAGFARVCGSEDKANVDANANAIAAASATGSAGAVVSGGAALAADVKTALAAPRIGGSVAAAGPFSVELALHKNGLVEALVSDASGQLVSAGVKLSASMSAKSGAAEKLELAFAPAHARFEGRAKAGLELVPGPVDVSLAVAGKTHGCKLNALVALPEPRLGGHVLAAGAFSAEVFAGADNEVRAFIRDSAGAEVKGDANANFTARINGQGGAREDIALHFDAPRACFAGKAKAGVELAAGPLELVVDAKIGAGIGRLERIGLSVQASHGGQVVAVGDYSVELVAKGASISAFVFDAAGKADASGQLDLALDIGARAATQLALKWDAPSLSYTGKAGAAVKLSLEPIRISLVASGKAFQGAIASLDAVAKANLKADLNLKARSDAKVDGHAQLGAGADAKLKSDAQANASKAISGSVKITPPKINITTSKSATAKAGAGAGAKASAGFSFGTK